MFRHSPHKARWLINTPQLSAGMTHHARMLGPRDRLIARPFHGMSLVKTWKLNLPRWDFQIVMKALRDQFVREIPGTKDLKFNSLGPGDAFIDDLVQDCSNSIANALELLQSCTKPSIYVSVNWDSIGPSSTYLYRRLWVSHVTFPIPSHYLNQCGITVN